MVERPSSPNTLISAAALLGHFVDTGCMLLSGPRLSLLFYLRTYLQVGPEVQESDAPGATISTVGEGYREYRPTSHPAGGECRGTFYTQFCRTFPGALSSVTQWEPGR